ncbi:hypothetical protein CAG58_06925 [Vibrio sp. V31_P5A7T61]|nr:hypothetical protein [Vibrio sp. V31_P5A7T61]NAX01342.1 hypothetical protein [Vibrio sp. V34_P3A8T189]NAX09407.1 hypothetical protein [Vibrio sp. V40_P2S30T141]NAX62430.1 hypothetical protein [Vibrio sp. V32_P6A28T40]
MIKATCRAVQDKLVFKNGSRDGIYYNRDALRTYGMWSYRSYPLESR